MEGSLNVGATIDQTMETFKIGVIGGSSITYPNARFPIHALKEFTAGSALSQEEVLKE